MKQAGFSPAAIIETSPGNFQAWVKHPEQLTKELGTAAARKLAERFGGDPGAADWRHFGRLGGFTNRKRKYCDPQTGLHPFVKLVEASGAVYREAERFLADVRSAVERERREREQQRRIIQPSQAARSTELKSIDSFRGDPRYGGDGTRIDWRMRFTQRRTARQRQRLERQSAQGICHTRAGKPGRPITWRERSKRPSRAVGADD